MAQNFSPEIMDKIKSVTAMNYRDQAIWYLNAFWSDAKPAETEAETVFQLITAFTKEDHVKGKNGCELNPIQAFNVLQKRNQTLTALELKAQLRKVDIDANGEMALCEYLLFINERDPVAFVTNPQGQIDLVKLKALEKQMEELDALMAELQVKEAAAVAAEQASKQAEADAIEQEAKAKAAEQVALDEEAKVCLRLFLLRFLGFCFTFSHPPLSLTYSSFLSPLFHYKTTTDIGNFIIGKSC
jgi:hypothetical protein